jgi:hypothetical protein
MVAQLVCRIGACPVAGQASLAGALAAVADDPSLRVAWPEVSLDLPGPDRDQADTFELDRGLTDPIELLMRRQGLTEEEAIEAFRATCRRRAIAALLTNDPEVAVLPVANDQAAKRENDGDATSLSGGENVDMGVAVSSDSPRRKPPTFNEQQPSVSVTVAVDPQMPIPAAPLILPATPGYGSWGTES